MSTEGVIMTTYEWNFTEAVGPQAMSDLAAFDKVINQIQIVGSEVTYRTQYPDSTTPWRTIPELYRLAAEALERRGWVSGTGLAADGRMCTTSAINWSAGREYGFNSEDLMTPFALWLEEHHRDEVPVFIGPWQKYFSSMGFIQHWNDATDSQQGTPVRRMPDVIKALRECADEIEFGTV